MMMMLVLVLGTVIVFSSCSKDDDDPATPSSEKTNDKSVLIGTWVGTITQRETFNATLVINADGTYTETSEGGFNSFSGSWKDNGNGTVTLTNFFDPTFSYSLSGTKLTLTGNGWSATFNKK